MSLPPNHCRVAIVGASSLRGKELKQVLEDRGFPSDDVRLLDEEAVGTLTEAAGEVTLIRSLEEDSFEGVRFAFFAGDAAFAAKYWSVARRYGATVIDLSGALAEVPAAVPWIPSLDAVLAGPQPAVGKLFFAPAATAILACTVSASLAAFPVARLAMVFFQPVSERGQEGIDELETQTAKLLSFQSISQEVYDAQVAFNLLVQYGEGSRERLGDTRAALSRAIVRYLAGRAPIPAIQLIQAPVFYSSAFAAYVELASPRLPEELQAALAGAGLVFGEGSEPPVGNISVAGGDRIVLSRVEQDSSVANGYWLWGAADNVRLPAVNAVQVAEKLLAS